MSGTKQKILDVSLELFSQNGYSAVSIRDICKKVGIKESSVYYHVKNKRSILEELLDQFREIASGMMANLENSLTNAQDFSDKGYEAIRDSFFEKYLMDGFCNKVMRLMAIEQFNSEDIRKLYNHWLLEEPIRFQSQIFSVLMEYGAIPKADSGYLAVKYYSPVYFYAQRWLFSGELTEENKNSFRKEACKHMQVFFTELGGHNG